MAGPGSKSLSEERAQAARAFTQRLVQERFAGNTSAAARALGVSQAQLYEFLNGIRGPGMKMLEAVADHARVSLDSVLGRAPEQTGERSVEAPDDLADPSPERAAAVRFARANGLPEAAIRAVQALPVRQRTPEQWYDRIKVEAAELRTDEDVASAPPTPPRSVKRRAKS